MFRTIASIESNYPEVIIYLYEKQRDKNSCCRRRRSGKNIPSKRNNLRPNILNAQNTQKSNPSSRHVRILQRHIHIDR